MLRKITGLFLCLLLMIPSVASAATFEQSAETVISYITENLKAAGFPNRFTHRDQAMDQQLSALLNYDYQSYYNQTEDVYCAIQGHNAQLEVFEAATSDIAYYEEMLFSSLVLVQGIYGICPEPLIEWAYGNSASITQSPNSEMACLYELGNGAFFLMHRLPGSTKADPTIYYASVYFPCESQCPFTELVAYMRSLSPDSAWCSACGNTGIIVETYAKCDVCDGACYTGSCRSCRGNVTCKVCEGKGYLEIYNYVFEYNTYRDCNACDKTGSCRTCRGTGLQECKHCEGLGYRPASSPCPYCSSARN